jgi:dienelactone hydrolase
MRTTALLTAALGVATSLSAQTPPEHDVTEQSVVWVVPGLDQVAVRKDVPYKTEGATTLGLDVYSPPGLRAGELRPAVVFINGVGDAEGRSLKDWGIYRSWARTIAASGWIGVTFASRGGPRLDADIADAFAFLAKDGARLGVDTHRIAAWACSANVTAGLKFLMDRADPSVVGAVIYYGQSEPSKIRTDLPVYFARAGLDSPRLNAAIDALWARAVAAGAPWQMVNAPGSHHAFDALDETEESRRIVRETLAFYRDLFDPPPAPPTANAARRALSYWFGNEYGKAADAYAEYLKTHPDDGTAWLRLGLSQAHTSQPAAAQKSLEKAISLGGSQAVDLYNVACGYALLGQKDRALDALERAVAGGFRNRRLLERDDDLASLRGDERFQRILARLAS